jgi:hypothetical protein
MKPECERCLLKDKSEKACIKRLCRYSNYVPPVPVEEIIKNEWKLSEDEIIGDSNIKIQVTEVNQESGNFTAKVLELDDVCKSHGHFGSYISVGNYYWFEMIGSKDDLIWEIPSEGTDRFHREGSTGAQFLLYWFEETGFTFDLDS